MSHFTYILLTDHLFVRFLLLFFFFLSNRYVENICKNPTEEKYRKIKVSNKVFQVCMKLASGASYYLTLD